MQSRGMEVIKNYHRNGEISERKEKQSYDISDSSMPKNVVKFEYIQQKNQSKRSREKITFTEKNNRSKRCIMCTIKTTQRESNF